MSFFFIFSAFLSVSECLPPLNRSLNPAFQFRLHQSAAKLVVAKRQEVGD